MERNRRRTKLERAFRPLSSTSSSRLLPRACRRAGALALVLLTIAAVTPASQADDITVTTALDVTADDGECSLREAIIAANTGTASGSVSGECAAGAAGSNTIQLPAGIYTLTIASAVDEDGSNPLPASGDLDITSGSDITIQGTGASQTIIQACTVEQKTDTCANLGGTGISDRIFDVEAGATLTLDGVTLRHGRLLPFGRGGGIFVRAGTSADDKSGTLTVTNSVVTRNIARDGGGIHATASNDPGAITVAHSTISDNEAAGSLEGGGGIYLRGRALAVNISSSTISGNRTTQHNGGGLLLAGDVGTESTRAEIITSLISDNTASAGGGIAIKNSIVSKISDNTITGNTASSEGGGLYVENPGEPGGNVMFLQYLTITANTASWRGGGFAGSGDLSMRNVILAGNNASSSPDCYGNLGSASTQNIIVKDASGCLAGANVGELIVVEDPLLGPLADNGGSTLTHALLPGSPAIDGGCIGGVVRESLADQRGVPRPPGGDTADPNPLCDLGAYEAIKVSVDDVSQDEGDSGTTAFTFTVSLDQPVPEGGTVTVDYVTEDGTATAGQDYTLVSGTLTFGAGATIKTVTVPVQGDATAESDETFVLKLMNPSNAVLGDDQGTGTIQNDDGPPAPTFASIEPTSGVQGTTMNVTLTGTNFMEGAAVAVSGSGVGVNDVTVVSGTSITAEFVIDGSATTGAREVTVTTDGGTSGAQTFTIESPTLDDTTPTVSFDLAGQFTTEAAATATVTVRLSKLSSQDVTVPFTIGGTATEGAQPGADYSACCSPLTIPAGQSAAAISVTLVNDGVAESAETAVFTLDTPTNADLGTITVHTLTIISDEALTPFAATGTPQEVVTLKSPAAPLTVRVEDADGHPVAGAQVTFTAPDSGPSGVFPGPSLTGTVTTDAAGLAVAPTFTANRTLGSYMVTATASGQTSAEFALTNVCGTGTLTVTNKDATGPGSLRGAVAEAAGCGETIVFADDVTGILFMERPLLVLDKDLTIEGPGADKLRIDGGFPPGSGLRYGHGIIDIPPGRTVAISGLTFTGSLDAIEEPGIIFNPVPELGDGWIRNRGTATLSGVIIRSGALFNGAATSDDHAGWGVGVANHGTLLMTDSEIIGSRGILSGIDQQLSDGAGFNGSGIHNRPGASAVLRRVTIRDRVLQGGWTGSFDFAEAATGAAIRNLGTMRIENSTITNNVAQSQFSTGDKAANDGLSSGSDRLATVKGGAIYNRGPSLTIINSAISGNLAHSTSTELHQAHGGGIYHLAVDCSGETGDLTIVNSTVADNVVTADADKSSSGGGIFTLESCPNGESYTVTLVNSTVAGNSAESHGGGGIADVPSSRQQIVLENTIVAGNSALNLGANLKVSCASVASNGHNVVGDSNFIFCGTGDGLQDSDITNQDPLLGPLADNGGPTLTMLPLPGSPAIDAGLDADATETTDQRGFARKVATVDIGAAEFQGLNLAAAAGTPQSAVVETSFAEALAALVTETGTGAPLTGTEVEFTAPATGATATFAGPSATTTAVADGNGVATAPALTASSETGSYTVTAASGSVSTEFQLTNTAQAAPMVSFSVDDVSQDEGDSGTTDFTFTVSLDQPVPEGGTVTVDFATADGTATAGEDYTAVSGTLTFDAGETTRTVTVQVHGDATIESDETFVLELSNPSNAVLGDDQGVGTIVNDDAGPPGTILVTTTADVIANDGECSLREAIIAANTNTASGGAAGECPAGDGDDTIILPGGTYTLTIDGSNEDAAAKGDLDITNGSTITIAGAGVASTIIQACTVSQIGGVCTGTGIESRVFHVISGGDLTLEDLTVQHGRARAGQDGGGINARGSLTVTRGVVTANFAPVQGGGIWGDGTLTITESTISGNFGGDGGGIAAIGGMTLLRSTVSGNTTTGAGGGIGIGLTAVTIANVTVSGNTAASGGGVFVGSGSGHAFVNATIAANTATANSGGGLDLGFGATVTLTNTILAGGSGTDCSVSEGTLTDGGSNFIEDGDCGDIVNGENGSITGIDPDLGPLANNGGLTLTHLPDPGSRVINAGDADVCADDPVDGIDQRGETRPATGCNIGAVEAADPSPTISEIADQIISEDAATSALAFEIGDDDTPAGGLTVTATSDDPALVPNDPANLALAGSGANRTLTVMPAPNANGTAMITVTVDDGTHQTSTTFTLSVTAVNDAPVAWGQTWSSEWPNPENGGSQTDVCYENCTYFEDFGAKFPVSPSPRQIYFGGQDAEQSELTVTIVSAECPSTTSVWLFDSSTGDETPVLAGDLNDFVVPNKITPGKLLPLLTFRPEYDDWNDPNTAEETHANLQGGHPGPHFCRVEYNVTDDGGLTSANNVISIDVVQKNDIPRDVVFPIIPPGILTGVMDEPLVFKLDAEDVEGDDFDAKIFTCNKSNGKFYAASTQQPDFIDDAGNLTVAPGDPDFDAAFSSTPIDCEVATSSPFSFPTSHAETGGKGWYVKFVPDPGETGMSYNLLNTVYDDGVSPINALFGTSRVIHIVASNEAPTISDVADQTIDEDGATAALDFVVGDVVTPAAGLAVTATSSNQALVPDANLALGGSGADRTITVTPAANANGTATITITVSDGVNETTDTFSLTVTSVNDAPVLTTPGPQTVDKDGSLVFSAANGNAVSVSDVDAGAGEVEVTLTATSTVTLVTTADLSFTSGDGTDDEQMTFTGTLAAVNAALDGLSYRPTPDKQDAGSLTIAVDDQGNTGSGGALTDEATITINVDGANDAPTITDVADQTIEEDGATAALDFVVGDVETPAADLTVTATSSNQALVPDANLILAGNGADRTLTVTPAPNAHGIATITITVGDGTDETSDSFTLTVTPVADTPAATDAATDEDVQTSSGLVISRNAADGTEVTHFKITNVTGGTLFQNDGSSPVLSGTFITFNEGHAGLKFTPSANSTAAGGFDVQASTADADAGLGGAVVTATISVSAVNDAPVVTVPGDQMVDKDGQLVFSTANGNAVSITDVDVGSGELEVTLTATSTVTLAATADLTFTDGDGTADETMIFTGTLAAINAAFEGMTYAPTPDKDDAGSLTIAVDDHGNTGAGGPLTDQKTMTINVAGSNDAPTITDVADQTIEEDGATAALDFVVGDVETPAANLSVTAASSNQALVPNANLELAGSGADRTLTVTPAADANGTATITITVNDGVNETNDAFELTVTAVNDAPVVTVPGDQNVDEDGQLVFSTANGNAVGIADVDVGSGELEVTLIATSTVTLSATTDLAFMDGDGTADETMTFTGTLAAINAALEGMIYEPTLDKDDAGSLTIAVDDQGHSGEGGPLTDQETITINIAGADDAPTITGISDQTIDEDAATGALAFTVGDLETAAADLTVTATSNSIALVPNDPANLTLGGAGANRTLTVTPVADANGAATITVTVDDGTFQASDAFVLTVTAVNDAPVVSVPGAQTVDEDGALVFSGANGNAVSVADVDAGAGEVEVTLTATSTVTLASTTDLTFTIGDGTADETTTFTGTLTAVNAALDGMTYEPTPDKVDEGSLTIRVDDQGNTGQGGALHDEAVIPITIHPVNDPPTISNIPSQKILEDGSTPKLTFTVGDVETDAADLVVTAISDDEGLVFNNDHFLALGGTGPDRTLVVTPRSDANGRARITITVDDGTDTAEEIVVVDITPVNDPPSFDPGSDQTAQEDGGPQTVAQWATTIRPGPANEGDQAVEFVVTNDNESLFSAQPAISPEGELTYTPAPGATGSANVDVRLQDDGGTENGGIDTSKRIAFTISVADVNDAPTISEIGEVSLLEDTSYEAGFIVGDPETAPADLTVTAASDNPALLDEAGLLPGGSGAERTLTILPLPDAYGEATVTLTVSDGVLDASTSFHVTVTPVNDAPVLDASVGFALPDVLEDDPSPAGTLVSDLIAGAITDMDAGDPRGIALIGANSESGTWQYALGSPSTDASRQSGNGTSSNIGPSSATTTTTASTSTWTDIGAMSESAALLLPDEASIRFVPDEDVNGPIVQAIAFVAWDQSMGASGEAADATTRGGTTAFSAAAAAASIHIIPVPDAPDLELLVESDPLSARLGGTVTYSLMYRVLGVHDASGVILTATPPPGTRFVPESSAGAWEASDDGSFAFVLGDLDGGAAGSVPFAVEIPPDHPSALLLLEVEIEENGSTGGDSNPENNRAAHQLPVEAADLHLDLSIDRTSAARGETVTATARLANAGPDAATNVTIEFELPEGIELVEAEGFDPAGGRWDVAELAADGAADISAVIRIRPDAPDLLEAAARIAFAEQIDPTPDDRSAAAALDVVNAPPPPPDLTGPGVVPFDGEQDVDLSVTLNWPDVPDADRYRVVLTDSTGASKTGIIVDVDTLTAPSFALENLQPMHVYAWRIASIGEGGQGPWSATITFNTRATSVATERYGADLPDHFALRPNYPNPFNPATTVPFEVPKQADVRLEIYNILGQHITDLAAGPLAPGRYRTTWQADDHPSGIYFVRMRAGSFTAVRRLSLVK